jgi:hypothetical protein
VRTCGLCGAQNYDVKPALVRYRDGTYKSVDRCVDAIACEDRAIAMGRKWDVSRRAPPPRQPRFTPLVPSRFKRQVAKR